MSRVPDRPGPKVRAGHCFDEQLLVVRVKDLEVPVDAEWFENAAARTLPRHRHQSPAPIDLAAVPAHRHVTVQPCVVPTLLPFENLCRRFPRNAAQILQM
ncbi:MAG: hypothetical protein Q27BB25_12080 [Blastomonas sp. CACIA14H2]|nr:MAG: hypothetical protein Q27BB25_12080 [Blastomonas sp. CACIA14H2]